MALTELNVGEKYDFLKGIEGASINLTPGGLQLIVRFSNPEKEEINNYKNKEIKYKMLFTKNIIFFLFKFGDEDWIDVPFHFSEDDELEEISNNSDGYAITVFLGNSEDGTLEVMRLFSLNNNMSKNFYKLKVQQLSKDFSDLEYNIALNEVYRKYTTKDMLKLSISNGKYN